MSHAPVPSLGGYLLEEKIGEGGMGTVYRASHPSFPGRRFAVKVLNEESSRDPIALARFGTEMQAIAAVSRHPNVVSIVSGSLEGERPYFVMDLVTGTSLATLAEGRGLEPARAARIVQRVADAVAFVHDQGILHRDLKPDNVLIEAGDVPRVADFGIAHVAGYATLTRTGAFLGTPAFAAPEQHDRRARTVDARADVYSLGAILWYALVGRAPLEAENPIALTKKVLTEEPAPPSALRKDVRVSPDLDAICLKALRKEPEARYASVIELANDLGRFLAGEPVTARPPGRGASVRRALRRHSVALVCLGVLAIAGAGLALGVSGSPAPAPEPSPRTRPSPVRLALSPLWKSPEGLVAAAHEAIKGADVQLLGESGLGDLLLEMAESKRAPPEKLGRLAADLARARIDADARDLEAHALRAYATLARLGAPRRPLGVGRLGKLGTTEERERIFSDLDLATRLEGAEGARAAWLAVDLRCGTGDLEGARRARSQAVDRHDEHEARALLDRVVLVEGMGDREHFATLVKKLDGDDAFEAAVELSRLLALRGFPDAVEHVELARDPKAIAAALAASRPEALAWETNAASKPGLERALGEARSALEVCGSPRWAGTRPDENEENARGLLEKRRTLYRPGALDRVAAALEIEPCRADVLKVAGAPELGSGASVFTALEAAFDPEATLELDRMFLEGGRARTREGRLPVYYFADEWEVPASLKALDRVRAFDLRLHGEPSRNRPFKQAEADPRLKGRFEAARQGVRALRQLEVLSDPDIATTDADSNQLAFEAVQGLEALVRASGPSALPFRARLRARAFPGPFGRALARLDLERAYALALPPAADPGRDHEGFLRTAAAAASEIAERSGDAELGRVALDLFELAVYWTHRRDERIARDQNESVDDLRERLDRSRQGLGAWCRFGFVSAEVRGAAEGIAFDGYDQDGLEHADPKQRPLPRRAAPLAVK